MKIPNKNLINLNFVKDLNFIKLKKYYRINLLNIKLIYFQIIKFKKKNFKNFFFVLIYNKKKILIL